MQRPACENVNEAIAAMSHFPDMHQGLILKDQALFFVNPLRVQDVGIRRKEASLGSISEVGCDIDRS
jgi:hypothetical protein